MADWESLLLERAKQRDQPCISDLLELYGSCKYTYIFYFSNMFHFTTFPQNLILSLSIFPFPYSSSSLYLPTSAHIYVDTELKKRFISVQFCGLSAPQDPTPTCPKETDITKQKVQVLQEKLSQLQKKLTNSYRNKLNLDDSISQLHEKIERLEKEVSEKDKTISRLERTIAHLQSRST